jgi:integrase
MILEEWCHVWMAGLTLKPKTRAGYEQLLRSRILPRFGGYPLKSITTAEVRAFVTGIIEEGKVATARQARGLLSQALSTAKDDGLIARNPVESVKAPRVEKRRQLYLRADEVTALAAACADRQSGAGGVVMHWPGRVCGGERWWRFGGRPSTPRTVASG